MDLSAISDLDVRFTVWDWDEGTDMQNPSPDNQMLQFDLSLATSITEVASTLAKNQQQNFQTVTAEIAPIMTAAIVVTEVAETKIRQETLDAAVAAEEAVVAVGGGSASANVAADLTAIAISPVIKQEDKLEILQDKAEQDGDTAAAAKDAATTALTMVAAVEELPAAIDHAGKHVEQLLVDQGVDVDVAKMSSPVATTELELEEHGIAEMPQLIAELKEILKEAGGASTDAIETIVVNSIASSEVEAAAIDASTSAAQVASDAIEKAGANTEIVEITKPTVQVISNTVIPKDEKKAEAVQAAQEAGAQPGLAEQAIFGAVASREEVSTVTEAKHEATHSAHELAQALDVPVEEEQAMAEVIRATITTPPRRGRGDRGDAREDQGAGEDRVRAAAREDSGPRRGRRHGHRGDRDGRGADDRARGGGGPRGRHPAGDRGPGRRRGRHRPARLPERREAGRSLGQVPKRREEHCARGGAWSRAAATAACSCASSCPTRRMSHLPLLRPPPRPQGPAWDLAPGAISHVHVPWGVPSSPGGAPSPGFPCAEINRSGGCPCRDIAGHGGTPVLGLAIRAPRRLEGRRHFPSTAPRHPQPGPGARSSGWSVASSAVRLECWVGDQKTNSSSDESPLPLAAAAAALPCSRFSFVCFCFGAAPEPELAPSSPSPSSSWSSLE